MWQQTRARSGLPNALQVLSDDPSLLDGRDVDKAMSVVVHELAQEQLQITGILSRWANGDAT